MDAVSRQPCTIIFKYVELSRNDCAFLLTKELDEHLQAVGIEIPAGSKVPFFIIEDFNCTGLVDDKEQDFFYKDNVTNKREGNAGSHGIGKIVFSNFSEIKTFIAYSNYQTDISNHDAVVKGVASLKGHTIGNLDFKPDGILKLLPDDLPRKLFSRQDILQDTGLSIAIPFPRLELPISSLMQSMRGYIAEQCYVPILKGELELVFVVNSAETRIKSSSLNQIEFKKLLPRIKSFQQYLSLDNSTSIVASITEQNYQNSNLPEELEQALNAIDESDDACNFLVFELFVKINNASHGKIIMIIELTDTRCSTDFWRQNILIDKAFAHGTDNMLVTVLIEGSISDLLRELEDPGHSRWKTNDLHNIALLKRYDINAKQLSNLVAYIARLPKLTAQYLQGRVLQSDKNYAAGYFPNPLTPQRAGKSPQGATSKLDKLLKKIKVKIESSETPCVIDDWFTGFKVSVVKIKPTIKQMTIKAAYDDGSSSSFPYHHSSDFDFLKDGDIEILTENCDIVAKTPNSIIVNNIRKGCKVFARGFDIENRELKIDLNLDYEKNYTP